MAAAPANCRYRAVGPSGQSTLWVPDPAEARQRLARSRFEVRDRATGETVPVSAVLAEALFLVLMAQGWRIEEAAA